ncbi:MAG: hypothetical protein ACTHPS_09570 [Streptosporangiaceae bacterium]
MPELDETATAGAAAATNDGTAGAQAAGTGRAGPSRRSMLRVAAGAGAAGIAATTLGGVIGGMAGRTGATPDAGAEDPAAAGANPLVLHVRDAASGEIDVFLGTTLTRLHDRDLATRIIRASRRRSAAIAQPHIPERTF